MKAIAKACATGEIPAEVALVVSNKVDAAGVEWAQEQCLSCRILPHRDFADREAHDQAIVAELRAAGVDWVCLAGYMRLLSPYFVAAYESRILNIHPSLLPAFPGLNAQAQALKYGVRVTGCTVHIVDKELDHGPIVEQAVVSVENGDRVGDLESRLIKIEHRTYVSALRRLLSNRWRLDGRRLVFKAEKIE